MCHLCVVIYVYISMDPDGSHRFYQDFAVLLRGLHKIHRGLLLGLCVFLPGVQLFSQDGYNAMSS